MFLYHLTINKGGGIQQAVYGNFSAAKQQEIVVAKGSILELLRPDENGRLQTICSTETYGVIRALAPFRLMGSLKDHLLVGSDSGRIVILNFNNEQKVFQKIHQETYGRSGCRRIVPGQYVCVDPKGRAAMVGAIEKQKFVYVLNRDSEANLTISSPLDAHKSHNICYSIVGLDMGFENPIFAAIELDYADADQDPKGEAVAQAQKHLTLYELDLGLNHVLRKWTEAVDNGANLLVPVPGGTDGPGGVLVCVENFLIYKNQGHPDVRAIIPRRNDLPSERGVLLICHATHKQKSMFFFLVQSEYGDLYKVDLVWEEETVLELKVKYFDTIPPCGAICVLKTGFLFAAAEFGNHVLYQFQGLGDDDDDDVVSSSLNLVEVEEGFQPVFFTPRPLRNLSLVDTLQSLAPLIDMQVENILEEEIPQIFLACGKGPRSSLKMLRSGVTVQELAVSPLPGNPTAVWTVKRSMSGQFDSYIVVSFTNATLVLSIGETVEEVNDSGFLGMTSTLAVHLLGDDSLVQVHPQGIRHIRTDRRINEWRVPGRRQITKVTCNSHQVVIVLMGGEIIYFELDQIGQLLEMEKLQDTHGEISCIDIAKVTEGRTRSRFLGVGCYDGSVRVLSLDLDECLQQVSTIACQQPPESVLILDSNDGEGVGALFLHIGLSNGVLMRVEMDRSSGKLTDIRNRFLGTRSLKLLAATIKGSNAMLVLTTRPWLAYQDMGRFNIVPLAYLALDHACSFSSEQCPEGFVVVAKNTLRIIALDRLEEPFNQSSMRLRYTPRKLLVHPETKYLITIESDQGTIPLDDREDMTQGWEMDSEKGALEEQQGSPKGMSGQWASCVRLTSASLEGLTTLSAIEMDNNEAALCMALVKLHNRQDEGYMLAIGTAQGLRFCPQEAEGGYIRLYRFVDRGRRIQIMHKTSVEGIPGALCGFQGRLLAGVGQSLSILECGKKKLLRKCEHRKMAHFIKSLHTMGDRVYVGDIQESFHYLKYKKQENLLYIYADDIAPRYITSSLQLDYDTLCGGDKFGNFFVVRLAVNVSAEVEEDPTGGKFVVQKGMFNGAPNKLSNIIQFHVGDMITAMSLCSLQPGGKEVILYGTVAGRLGVFFPITSQVDVDLSVHLEMHLRQERPPLCGRDHLAYRSQYFPTKAVVDGDLCEEYARLPVDRQRKIAEDLDRTQGEVFKKLEDIRNRIF